jgi:hypothetical protein
MSDHKKSKRRKSDEAGADEEITNQQFMALADKFIELANKKNEKVKATALHMAFLYAAARYNAHVAKNVLNLPEHEPFVTEMMKVYQEMLRNHLADPNL